MVEWLMQLSPWQQALAGTLFTYAMTALGAALVYFLRISIKMF
ncbi:Metal transporter, ZIP family [Enterococcus sp. HSIEG1]|nr:Metal transporter, ZIP family [Enterococcus sp. HSIEG1]